MHAIEKERPWSSRQEKPVTAGSGSAVEVDVGYQPGRSRDPGTPFNSSHIQHDQRGAVGGGHFQPGTVRLTIGL